MRQPQTQTHWVKECAFITDVTDGVLSGLPDLRQRLLTEYFSGNVATFIRYCEMQRDFATKDGFFVLAQYIGHCIDDLKGE